MAIPPLPPVGHMNRPTYTSRAANTTVRSCTFASQTLWERLGGYLHVDFNFTDEEKLKSAQAMFNGQFKGYVAKLLREQYPSLCVDHEDTFEGNTRGLYADFASGSGRFAGQTVDLGLSTDSYVQDIVSRAERQGVLTRATRV